MASRLGIISAYSLLYGVLMPGAILEACRAHEISTIAITDIAGIHGLHAFREEAEEYGVTHHHRDQVHHSPGTSVGLRLFCTGICTSYTYPVIAGAGSRCHRSSRQ